MVFALVGFLAIGLVVAFSGFGFIFRERISAILFAPFHGLELLKAGNLGSWTFILSEDPAR